jgi:peptidoglycan/LPS O-acetylase OafA/YrhL
MLDERRHVVELQSLRGLASIIVLNSHVFTYYATPAWFVATKNIVFNGQGGVVLFFVLSGFVLANALRTSTSDWRSLAAFYTKRLFRIYPALWTASVLGFIYLTQFHFNTPHPGVSAWFMERFKAERMIPIGYALALMGALSLLVPPVWTIFNEIVGSAVLPVTARLSFDSPRWGIVLAIALALVGLTIGPLTYYGVLLYPMDFQIGVLIAVLFARHPELKQPAPIWLVILGGGVFAIVFARGLLELVVPGLKQLNPFIHAVELAGAAGIILAVNANPITILRNKLIKDLGDISYSVYLLHFPIMCFAGLLLARLAPGDGNGVLETLVLCVATVAVTIAAATAVYRFIETPFIALGKRWASRLVQTLGADRLDVIAGR